MTSARQCDHARRDINPDATGDVRCQGEEVTAVATAEVQHHVRAPNPGQLSHQRESIFEQPLRVTVLLGRSRRGTSIEERSDVRGVA